MKKIIRKVARKVAPGLADVVHRTRRIEQAVNGMQSQLSELKMRDDRLDLLRSKVAEVEPYQPTYGISGIVDSPRRASRERCLTIESALRPVPGKRILDIGSSLGFFSFYFADRGAVVQGWEENVRNAEVARLISDINGIEVDFRTKEFNSETVTSIEPGKFDVAFILSVFHHIIRFNGLEYTQELVKELMQRVPTVVVELAKKGEDPSLPWDASQPADELAIFDLVKDKIEVKKLGDFGNHLSKKTRPLYIIRMKQEVAVGSRTYAYQMVSGEAYKDSPVAHRGVQRRYYFSEDLIIKEYSFDAKSSKENITQILNEIKVFLDIQNGKNKIYHAPQMIDFDINYPVGAKMVVERIPGVLASDLEGKSTTAQTTKLMQDVLKTLADLSKLGLHHNDIRSWNIIVNNNGSASLIDYGLASATALEDDIISLLWVAASMLKGERESYDVNKVLLPDADLFTNTQLSKLYAAVKKGERSPDKLLETLAK